MQRTAKTFARRAGVTLIELLVVVTIMVMLMAYATSIIKPTLEDRKSRESAQLINSYIMNAQARAADLGRPVGVYLERSPNDDNKVLQIYTAITPPPFVGSVASARARFGTPASDSDSRAITNSATPPQLIGFNIDSDASADVRWLYKVEIQDSSGSPDLYVTQPLVMPGDTIKFDYKGHTYRIVTVNNGVIEFAPLADDVSPATAFPEPTHLLNKTLPFQIYRRPQKSIASPIELPTGMAIDLALSGFGVAGQQFGDTTSAPTDNRSPIVIMYRPSGDLDFIYVNNAKLRPLEPINFMVGSYEYENVYGTSPASVTSENLIDDRNRWVTIRPRGGEVFATKVALNPADPTTTTIEDSRALIRSSRGSS